MGTEVPLLRKLNVLFFSQQPHGISTALSPSVMCLIPTETAPLPNLEIASEARGNRDANTFFSSEQVFLPGKSHGQRNLVGYSLLLLLLLSRFSYV